jgi:hypothetical protein
MGLTCSLVRLEKQEVVQNFDYDASWGKATWKAEKMEG